MNGPILIADIIVPMVGALLCVMPAITKPTIQFGVRVPAGHVGADVIRGQRRAYYWRTAAIGACCTAAALLLRGAGSWWLPRIILVLEVAADIGCLLLARKKITAVKHAEHWFAGLRQTVVADTSWRADPPRFPRRWLLPALAVVAATVVIGVVRYPGLPGRLGAGLASGSGRAVPKSLVSAFAVVAGQLYVTALWTGLLLLVYRARPDIEAADPAGSASRYRRFLAMVSRAMLALVALADLSLMLAALQKWQVYRLSGAASVLPLLPFVLGLLIGAAVVLRTGQAGFRLPAGAGSGDRRRGASRALGAPRAASEALGTDRDDDRFWKAGLLYVNRDDPALLVGARFGPSWTLNLANPAAWLLIAGAVAGPAGLAAIIAAAR
jgi:uncharacterized membrane protein